MNFKMNQHRAMNVRSAAVELLLNHWVARMCSSCCLIMNPSSCSYQFYLFFYFLFLWRLLCKRFSSLWDKLVVCDSLIGRHRDIWLKAYQLIISRDWSATAQFLLGRLTMTNTEREWRAVRLTSMSRRFTFWTPAESNLWNEEESRWWNQNDLL